MKKVLKIIGIVLISIIFIYIIFIAEESIRLKKDGGDPLIKVDKCSYTGNKYKCKGLGYSITREYTSKQESSDVYYLIGEEFWLFDKILLWGWIS